MMEAELVTWDIPERKRTPVERLASELVASREIDDLDGFLHPDYSELGDPFDLLDMRAAVDHLRLVRAAGKKVAVYGDYDIDGLTSTTLLTEVFQRLGIDVVSYIPDRFVEGYGLHTPALLELQEQGVDTVVTVDCGITAVEPIREAAEQGLHIIVTDHHTLADEEPVGAVALINPLREKSKYPERLLSGVGVAFALARALQQEFPDEFPVGQEKWLLDLVALGTICDVVPLVGENRNLAYFGLQVARKSRRAGFQALAEVSAIELSKLSAQDFGFKFGPRLNAAGRLEHAKAALAVLMASSKESAMRHARKLDELNRERRALTERITVEARAQAEDYVEDYALVLSGKDWSHGVAGLVASRIAESTGKPTIILQVEGDTAKGSARSFGKFSLISALREQSELFERFGGHAAAAGMTMPVKNIPQLRKSLSAYCAQPDQRAVLVREILADTWLEAEYVTEAGLNQLELLEPTGQANPEVRFYLEAPIETVRWVGKDGAHAQVTILLDGQPVRSIAFRAREQWPWLDEAKGLQAIAHLRGSEWNGRRRAELVIIAARQGDMSL